MQRFHKNAYDSLDSKCIYKLLVNINLTELYANCVVLDLHKLMYKFFLPCETSMSTCSIECEVPFVKIPLAHGISLAVIPKFIDPSLILTDSLCYVNTLKTVQNFGCTIGTENLLCVCGWVGASACGHLGFWILMKCSLCKYE